MRERSLAIVGYGKMGRAIEQLAAERGWHVAAVLDREREGAIDADSLRGATVAVEFTEPSAAPGNIRAIVDAGCAVVVGTTGWYDRLGEITRYVQESGGAMLWAPNFSLGVQLMLELARTAGEMLSRLADFDAHMIETHHAAKKDSPSGTANAIEEAVRNALGRRTPITSVRTGHVPGTHELIFDAPYEQIRLVHTARDRRVFAAGAMQAAEWLLGRRGVFTIGDMLRGPGDSSE